jgi:hypothetical protein
VFKINIAKFVEYTSTNIIGEIINE